ncbi:hypothetical protein GDO78_018875 [Eleutherodactylus coqui]|uniref:Proteasomal ATPase-associated factor 1 n=1 Tax=Eleutherodactylus coqui TaxID=57060 RepID=A0A8J6BK45_ELECQ|nr:hypothetical protein GDO78_018875 [Eleutherodactylus coqui]
MAVFVLSSRKAEGEAWVSCKIPGKPTVYGTLKCEGIGPDGIPEITSSEEFTVLEVTKKSLLISCLAENVSSKFLAPYTSFPRVHQKSVTCLDVSSGGGLGVSTSADGSMKIWQTNNGEIRRVLEGHIYDVNCCTFFPSGMVVLSGGMDAQVKIWSVEDASCPVTFRGHKAGGNVVSSSRDGTARLWDCGKSACLAVVADCGAPINGISLGVADNAIDLGTPETPPSDREIATEGKLLLLAREDKKLEGVSLQSRQSVFTFDGADAFNCCTFLSSVNVIGGGQDGNLYLLDLRNTKVPVQTVSKSGAPVLSLAPFREGFIATHGDGTCFVIQQDLDHVLELTEPDCDPVYKVAVFEKCAYTCCRDGMIRKYQLTDL